MGLQTSYWPSVKTLPIAALLCLCFALPLAAQQVDDTTRQQIEAIIKDFERKKYDAVIDKITELEPAGESGAFMLNLKGAAYTKKKEYDQAIASFRTALELSPGLFAAQFNLGEVHFLQRQYPEALAIFRDMLNGDPRNELLQFKVFLCHLQLEDELAAKKALSTMKFPGDTPSWYYSQAAWEFSKGNKRKASDYLSGARFIFPGKTEIFDETFADLGLPRR